MVNTNRKPTLIIFVSALFVILSVCLPSTAQVATGTLLGLVTDPSGRVIPGAHVKVREVDTGMTKSLITPSNGIYRFPLLPVGDYRLTASAAGFQQLVQSNIHLSGSQTLRLDLQLRVGAVSTVVQVKAAALAVNTESMALTTVIGAHSVENLPLNGRNAIQLVLLAPGTVNYAVGTYQQTYTFPGRIATPINGARGNMVNFTIDGADANDNYTNVADPVPNPDVIQEIDVLTNGFSARYGKSGGGVVNIITKSGTNALHGDAFEFLRNQDLDAENLFTGKLDGLKQNQFGFTLGGPVVIPRIYNGKDRTFFFASYQGTKVRSAPTSASAIVPTAAERSGDFSAIKTPIINPATGLQFPGNRITTPESIFAKNILAYIPVAQPIPNYPLGTLFYTTPTANNIYEWTAKVDRVEPKRQLSLRYFIDNYTSPAVWTGNLLAVVPPTKHRYQSGALNATFNLTPRLLNQFIFSADENNAIESVTAPFNVNTLGAEIYAPPGPSQVTFSVKPDFLFKTGTDYTSPRTNFQWADNFTYVRGRHELLFGGNIQRVRMGLNNPGVVSEGWTYNGSRSGNSLADLYLGLPYEFEQSSPQYVNIRDTLYALYGQDNFQVNRRLMLNLGLRWEPSWPGHDILGRGAIFEPGMQSQRFPLAPKGLLYYGDPGVPRGLWSAHVADLAPRIGFAADPFGDKKTSIRGGYGIFYDMNPTKIYIGYGQVPPFSAVQTVFAPPSDIAPLSIVGNPFPYTPGPNTPIPKPQTVSLVDKNRSPSYVQSWNFTIERQLVSNMIMRIGYVGSKGTHLEASTDDNAAIFIPGASTVANIDSRRPYISDGLSTVLAKLTDANSNYNSLQAGVQWRFRSRISVQANYVYSKSMDNVPIANGTSPAYTDPFNENAYYGPSDYDTRHRAVLSYTLAAPTPNFGNELTRYVLGHWSTSGILTAQSGNPLTIFSGVDTDLTGNGDGYGGDHANLVGNPKIPNPTISQWFNQAAFAVAPLGSFGNAGRGIVYGPGLWNADLAVFRDFPLPWREGAKVEFRADFFNALNHVNPSNPTTKRTSANFGEITSYAGPRIIQLALKFVF